MTDTPEKRPFRLKSFGAALAFALYNHCIGRLPGYGIRRAYWRRILGIRIGSGAAIHMGCFVTDRNITIGARTVLNRGCHLDGRGGLSIGADVSISPGCCLLTATHDVQDPAFAPRVKPVVIGDRAWIGTRALILPGVTLGEGAVVGAGSVVSRDVEPYAIVAGNPARKIGERNRDLRYSLSYFPYFDTDIQPG